MLSHKYAWLPLLGLWWAAVPLWAQSDGPCDAQASRQTQALFYNLRALTGQHTLFGHQDDLAYGVYWKAEPGRSDVKDASGAYPAVFGWDLGKLGPGVTHNIDTVSFEAMRRWMRQAYRMGSVNTISWHVDHPTTGGGSWDTTPVVRHLLPGGQHHQWLLDELDGVARYLDGLHNGGLLRRRIPIVFRPWHENNGAWFWWGKGSCTPEEYIALWRFTVHYLRDVKGLHHLLFAYSPSHFANRAEYLLTYPGDDYVDILGLDFYFRGESPDWTRAELGRNLADIADLAAEKQKIAALTETGFETIPDPHWWTHELLDHLVSPPANGRIAYVLVWRNARPSHYYAPFSGHASEASFRNFAKDSRVMMQDSLPRLYRRSR